MTRLTAYDSGGTAFIGHAASGWLSVNCTGYLPYGYQPYIPDDTVLLADQWSDVILHAGGGITHDLPWEYVEHDRFGQPTGKAPFYDVDTMTFKIPERMTKGTQIQVEIRMDIPVQSTGTYVEAQLVFTTNPSSGSLVVPVYYPSRHTGQLAANMVHYEALTYQFHTLEQVVHDGVDSGSFLVQLRSNKSVTVGVKNITLFIRK